MRVQCSSTSVWLHLFSMLLVLHALAYDDPEPIITATSHTKCQSPREASICIFISYFGKLLSTWYAYSLNYILHCRGIDDRGMYKLGPRIPTLLSGREDPEGRLVEDPRTEPDTAGKMFTSPRRSRRVPRAIVDGRSSEFMQVSIAPLLRP